MTFQGDVAGLGLGELLQGLARGGREGVLNLIGGGITARIGVLDGQLTLLPEEGEDPEIWRRRCERAWANDLDERIDSLRMREIAQASRLETMFQLLDCHGVHFRFEPGSVDQLIDAAPKKDGATNGLENRLETGVVIEVRSPILCPPVSVEYILLEHARLSDELGSYPDAAKISGHFVPRITLDTCPQRAFERLWKECDGSSSVAEISDRLGWPMRQARVSLCGLHALGALRLADAPEMLALAQHEFDESRSARAASRLSGWCVLAAPGPAAPDEARFLLELWAANLLQPALEQMTPRAARTLLAKIDGAERDNAAACARWSHLRQIHRTDFLVELFSLHRQQASPNEADWPAINDLLRVARRLQDKGHPWLSGILLRTAAARSTTPVPVRLEIGQRMLAVGLQAEGASWIIDASRSFVAQGAPERAVAALRQLLQEMPTQREARALLGNAYGRTASGRRVRRNTLIGLAAGLVVSVAAVVHVRTDQAYQEKLAAVREELGDPQRALSAIDMHFGDGGGDEIAGLRAQLLERLRDRQIQAQQDWIADFLECNLECTGGDPVLGLRNALALPPPPAAPAVEGVTPPKLQTLLDNLAARLEDMLLAAGQSTDLVEQSHAEQRLERLIEDLLAVTTAVSDRVEISNFRGRLESLELTLRERAEIRATEREKELRSRDMERLDALYAAGTAHAAAGDLARAVDCFEQFAKAPGADAVLPLFRAEIDGVRAHHRAYVEARELAAAGRHAEALAALAVACPRPSEHLLPCRIDSVPSGAYVRFSDGSTRTTPFVLEAAPGVRVRAKLEATGCASAELAFDDPCDRVVLLSREPDALWPTQSKVEAPPISVHDDHVVCDRAGRVARIDSQGKEAWSATLPGLMGVRHAPVFLPRRPGHLFIAAEDGNVWIVDASNGRVEGPWSTGSQPLGGPVPTQDGAKLRTVDGRVFTWSTRVAAETEQPFEGPEPELASTRHDAGLAIRRRSVNESNLLESPWGQGRVLATDTHFTFSASGSESITFAVQRTGEWSYMAFEAPSARASHGRLWLSDGAGLRVYALERSAR